VQEGAEQRARLLADLEEHRLMPRVVTRVRDQALRERVELRARALEASLRRLSFSYRMQSYRMQQRAAHECGTTEAEDAKLLDEGVRRESRMIDHGD
jgi:hypothetical protein